MGQIKVEKNVEGIEGLCVIEPAVQWWNPAYLETPGDILWRHII